MPETKNVRLRYEVLNRCFRNIGREYDYDDLLKECNKALRENGDREVSLRTIKDDITNLKRRYNIPLDKTFRRGRTQLFRYTDTNYTLPFIMVDDTDRHKIQDALRELSYYEGEPLYDWTRHVLIQIEAGMFDDEASSYVSFQCNPDLQGQQHFAPLLQAIIHKHALKLHYTPFGKDTTTLRISPYHLKQYNDRWYLIAYVNEFEFIANFALDRIERFEEIAIPYKESEIDFTEYFDDIVGVTSNASDPIDIVFKVSKESMGYVKTKPIHLSQRCLEETDDYAIFSINVKTNYELDSKLLSFGTALEVLAPAPYRLHMANKIRLMYEKYANNAENLHT